MPETIRCPECGASNASSSGGAPFFCVGCKAIVDPSHRIHAEGEMPHPSQPVGAKSVVQPGPSYVSRYGSTEPRDAVGPGAGMSVGGSPVFGLILAAIVGVGSAVAFGWLGAHYFRAPLLCAFVIGWLVKRALALGSGGGTPDRSPTVVMGLLAIAFASFGAMRYVEYLETAKRESPRYLEIFGESPAAAVADPSGPIGDLHEKDRDHDGTIVLHVDESTIKVEEEANKLRSAKATNRSPSDGYDIALLASTGHSGFPGYLRMSVSDGESLRFVPKSAGIDLPGIAILFLWILELSILLLTAYSRIE